MAEWRTLAECGDTKTDGNCRWCGKKLRRPMTDRDPVTGAFPSRVRDNKVIPDREWNARSQSPRYDKPGDYGDGHFCGLRCGYMFGVELADKGRRLVPAK